MNDMKKEKLSPKYELIITTSICLLPILLSILLYKRLPDLIPVQWGNDGLPTSYKSKEFTCFGLPLCMAVLNIITNLTINGDPNKKNASKMLRKIVKWLIPGITILFVPFSLIWALGYQIPIVKLVLTSVGIIFILFGNYLPKSKINYTIGFKLPWTLTDEDNWKKTNHLAGYLMILIGVLFLISVFFSLEIDAKIVVAVIALFILIVNGYSYMLYIKNSKK